MIYTSPQPWAIGIQRFVQVAAANFFPLVEWSERDLLRGKPIEPAWYRVHIDELDAEGQLSKDKGSTNYNVEATILFNGDNGDCTFRNYPLAWNFNSKAMGFSRGLLESIGVAIEAKKRYRLEAATGKQVDVYVDNEIYQGRIVNKVNHKYRAIKEDVVARLDTTPTGAPPEAPSEAPPEEPQS